MSYTQRAAVLNEPHQGAHTLYDPYNLQRFLEAQEAIYVGVCAELRAGRKVSHWMWFIFPQISGLGLSPTAQFYAIESREEALAYLAHPVLGKRLMECVDLVNAVEGRTVHQIFGSPDDAKFKSCVTLFAQVANMAHDPAVFEAALVKYFDGESDLRTLEKL